ncbi:hypothetical protein ABH892_004189 [Paenibacillus sp. RC254]
MKNYSTEPSKSAISTTASLSVRLESGINSAG